MEAASVPCTYLNVHDTRPRHPINAVPTVVSRGQIHGGREAFRWLDSLSGAGATTADEPAPGDFAPASTLTFGSPSPHLSFTSFLEEKPRSSMVQHGFDDFSA